MKQKKLTSILAVTLSLELMVAPIIPSVQAQTVSATTQAAQTVNSTAEALQVGLQAAGNIWNQANRMMNPNSGMSPQMGGDMQKLNEQMQPQADKYFNPQKLSQIPGLGEYLAKSNINPNLLECKTLPTTLHDAKPEVCRIGIKDDVGVDQGSQLNQAFTYHNQYFQINKMYKNFTADSNSDGQAFGIGCMNNAMTILNGFFNYRMDELDKLTTNFEAMQNELREKSRLDLDAIEEAVAVLDGDSDIADKVRSKKPDLFDFSKRFNNPACNSMFSGEKLNDLGRSTGLNSINRNLKDQLTQKIGKYSGESYSQSHAAVLEDINSVADKISKQVELNFNTQGRDPKSYGDFLKSVPGSISSVSGVNDSIRLDMFSDVQTKYTEKFAKLAEDQATIASELKGSEKALSLMGGLNSANFEAEVNALENNVKNGCLQKTLSSVGTRKELMDKIYDPSGSKHANEFASNFLKDKLKEILDDNESTIEKKLTDLKALEGQQGNRYVMKMENFYEVQDVDESGKITTRVVDASNIGSPSVYFSNIIRNCNAQFKVNKLGNKLSGAGAIQRLRQLNTDFKTFAKTQAGDIKKEIRKKLIECSGPEVANNTVPGSCTPQLFNPSAPGFCANAAFSCSKNMQACSKQAEGFVKEIRDQKTARVNNYKALIQKNKQDIVKIFDSALARYMKDGEALRGMFGAGFSSPAGIKREVPEGQRYLTEFQNSTGKKDSPDGKLLLEDPDKYAEMFKKNIEFLKSSVSKQQEQILGGNGSSGLLADHVKKTMKNLSDVAKEANTLAGECIRKHDEAIARNEQARKAAQDEFAKTSKELGEKQQEFCTRFNRSVGRHPGPACDGNIEDLTRTLGNSTRSFQEFCDQTQGTSNGSSQGSRALNACRRNGFGSASASQVERSVSQDDAVITAQENVRKKKDDLDAKTLAETRAKRNFDTAPAEPAAAKASLGRIYTTAAEAKENAELAHTQAEAALTTAQNTARDRIARNPPASSTQSPASTTAETTPNNINRSALQSACAELDSCKDFITRDDKGKATGKESSCSDYEKNSAASRILEASGDLIVLSSESAPAFCAAGDNSGPNNFAKGLQVFSENLAGGASGVMGR